MRAVPHLVQVDQSYRSRGFQIVAVSEEATSTIDGFVKAKGATYPIVQARGVPRLYDIPGYPHAYIIDRQGKVIWRGHPAMVTSDMIEAWLAGAALPAGSAPSAGGSGSGWTVPLMVAVLLGVLVVLLLVRVATGRRPAAVNPYFAAPFPAGPAPAPGPAPGTAAAVPGPEAEAGCPNCGAPKREGRKRCMSCGSDFE
ncbi:hypothetical protein EDM80_05690 [bacterium]|nr:MAG: hypothetical protein EDM80_05690 [bacterium]